MGRAEIKTVLIQNLQNSLTTTKSASESHWLICPVCKFGDYNKHMLCFECGRTLKGRLCNLCIDKNYVVLCSEACALSYLFEDNWLRKMAPDIVPVVEV